MSIIESLAKALWNLSPARPAFTWEDHPNEDVRDHYRERAIKLLDQFVIFERYIPQEDK